MAGNSTRRSGRFSPPNLHPTQLANVIEIMREVREQLLAEHPDMVDDALLMKDMIEGETPAGEPDGIDIIRRLILCSIDLRLAAAGCKARAGVYAQAAADLRGREDRLEKAAVRFRNAASQIMQEAGIRSFPDDTFSAWIGTSQRGLAGEPDMDVLPEQFVKVERSVRKADLVKALLAGEEIPGAPPLSNAADILFVKAK
jgi:hypothetical protein